MGKLYVLLALILASTLFISSEAEQCGRQAGKKRCPACRCCSRWGWCGDSVDYCGGGCQSQCWGRLTLTNISDDGVVSIITQPLFDQMLKHRHDAACPARNFYTYDAFINAANAFSAFGTTGDLDTRKREIAAFFALTSHATNGGLPTALDEPYAWGYCLKEVRGRGDYCNPTTPWPCVPGKQYHGRGPIQISHNYNYGPAGRAIGVDLLENPDLVANDAVISFKTALWFWMTPQSTNPSYHDIVTGSVKGGLVLFNGIDADVENRTGFYRRYRNILGVSPGDDLDWAPHLVLPSAL